MIAAEISLRCRRNGARNFLVALAEVADDHGKLLLALAQKASTVGSAAQVAARPAKLGTKNQETGLGSQRDGRVAR
jgi:hypothetical protein